MFWSKKNEKEVYFVVWTIKQGDMQDCNTDMFFNKNEVDSFIADVSELFGDNLVSYLCYTGSLRKIYIKGEKRW